VEISNFHPLLGIQRQIAIGQHKGQGKPHCLLAQGPPQHFDDPIARNWKGHTLFSYGKK
jgi:hypothetical protein